ncbi:hypothetical protein F5887DRAFT_114556 [Amanita rubescens]|nr:hypothetical protein F5887DRAFT_114556 [Amanita rubescens]
MERATIELHALVLVQLCIERTEDRPFSFSFKASMYTLEIPQQLHTIQILEILVAHAERWRAAYFTADMNALEESLTKAKGRFRQLHTLQTYIPLGASCYRIASDLFEDAPNLARVSVADYHWLRLSNVTVLHIVLWPLSARRFFAELEQMTSLEELALRGTHHDLTNVPVDIFCRLLFSPFTR